MTVKETYNQIGDHFSRTRSKVWLETIPLLKKLKDGDQVFDVGCGNGRLLNAIPAQVEYTGIDFSETLIKIARRLHPGVVFITGDITKKEVWDKLGKFDAIFCIAVLHHIPEKSQQFFVLNKIKKHLKPNGFLFLTVWNLWQLPMIKHHFSRKSLKLKFRNWHWLQVPYRNRWQRFCIAFNPSFISSLLNEAGFEDHSVYYTDRHGKKCNFFSGRNICAVAKL